MKKIHLMFFVSLSLIGCNKDDNTPDPLDAAMYFPADPGTAWETTSVSELGWNTSAIQALNNYLAEKNTKSFMILVNGRIVLEEYFNGHDASTEWEWNSAGKTLVSATTGIAQQESLLNINNRVSDYLGTGWTSMPIEKENRKNPQSEINRPMLMPRNPMARTKQAER